MQCLARLAFGKEFEGRQLFGQVVNFVHVGLKA